MAIPERIATQKQTPQNLATPLPLRVAPAIIQAAALAQQVDDLFELRGLIKKSQAAEKALTQQITGILKDAGLAQFDGQQGIAILGERTVLTPDPQLFLEVLGDKAFGALRVSVEDARELMVPADSESATGPVLRVFEKKRVA
jgi:hypothetical protein